MENPIAKFLDIWEKAKTRAVSEEELMNVVVELDKIFKSPASKEMLEKIKTGELIPNRLKVIK
jgi:hypothetical protein